MSSVVVDEPNHEDTDMDTDEATIIRNRTPQQVESMPMIAMSTKESLIESEWIKAHINKRVCKRYVKATKPLPNLGPDVRYSGLSETCECGRTQAEHSSQAVDHVDAPSFDRYDSWNLQRDTQAEPTDAFGEVDFIDSTRKVAKYVRIDEQTSAEKIKHLLFNVWKLGKPTLVLSMIGDSTQAKPKVLHAVRRGLVKVMRCGAWTITGGVREGVIRVAGDAANKTLTSGKSVCLGIVPWGIVAHPEQLVVRNREQARGQSVTASKYRIPESMESTGLNLPLEPNHTHFLLVDNGTARLTSCETVMRSKVEDLLGNLDEAGPQSADDSDVALAGVLQVPVCYVYCGGDMRSFETVRRYLRKHKPVVVVAGSGGIADLIAYAVEHSQVGEVKDDLSVQQRGSLHKVFSWRFSDKSDEEIVKWLKDEARSQTQMAELTNTITSLVNEYGDWLHVFDARNQAYTDNTKGLDVCVLRAILKNGAIESLEAQKIYQLSLALQWDRSDIAQNEIFTNDFKVKTSVLTPIFTQSVAQNRPSFVRLLLEQGFNIRDYLTVEILASLYNEYGDTPFEVPLERVTPHFKEKLSAITLADVGRAITNLCGAMYYSSYQHDPAECGVSYHTLLISEEDHMRFLKQAQRNKKSASPEKDIASTCYSLGDAALHLFLYAVLMNRRELAMVFWKELTQNLPSALTASFLTAKMIKYATDRDVREEVTESAAYFGELAVGVLDACYSADQDHTHLHLIRELHEFADVTCLELAEIGSNMPFLAHPGCQTLLETVWRGEVRGDHSTFVLLLCSLFPPLIPLLIRFQKKPMPQILTSVAQPTLQSETSATVEADHDDTFIRPPPPVPRLRCCRFLQSILYFYVSPQVTFLNDVLSYLMFLALFTAMILGEYVDDCVADMTALEWLLIVWVVCLFTEEVRQLTSEPGTVSHKVVVYVRNPWNHLDIISISFLLVAEILGSNTQLCYMTLPYIRVLGGISIFIFYSRILKFFSANKHIGPKLVMIFRMLKDVLVIMSILVILVLGFTVVVVSVTEAGVDPTWAGFTGGLSQVYWSMFGNSPVSNFANITSVPLVEMINGSLVVTGNIDDPIGGYYLVLFLGFFVILTNLLLFNVLIAMFNYTFSVVQEKADEFWYYQRFKLVTEYCSRPALPAPLLILYHVWLLLRYIYGQLRQLCRRDDQVVMLSQDNSCKVRTNEAVERILVSWEDVVVDEYLEKVEQQEKDTVGKQVETVREHTTTIKETLQYVTNVVDNNSTHTFITSTEKRLAKLEAKTDELNSNIKEILHMLRTRLKQ